MYPLQRHHRLRQNNAIRNLVRETTLTVNDFIVPLFVVEGKNLKEEISAMPNYFCFSLDLLKEEVKTLWAMGLKSVLLFVKVPENLKDNRGSEALNRNGLMQRAIKTIRDCCPEMLVMTDVALDPYSSFGHDGVIENGQIANDITIDILAEMSLSHAQAGAHFIAPSDMMDGRVIKIRKALEQHGYSKTGIMSYSAKYASAFYSPFREALDSAPVNVENIPKNKKNYQMDIANHKEALKETVQDINEGADIVMIKPAMPYLDIIREIKNVVTTPVAAYQVSGEYAMLKAAAQKGWLDLDSIMLESLTSIKRAGADLIASYFAKDVVKLL